MDKIYRHEELIFTYFAFLNQACCIIYEDQLEEEQEQKTRQN
jgi:hypothetical protein